MSLRLVACPVSDESNEKWEFFLVNDGPFDIAQIVLEKVEWEWGDNSTVEHPHTSILKLSTGDYGLIFSGNDDELRMLFDLSGMIKDRQVRWFANLGMLYTKRDSVTQVESLGRLGIEVEAREQN